MIRTIFLLVTLLFSGLLYVTAQDFTFVNNTTVLNKSVINTPAHWYLECTNHTDHILNLRWKAHFYDIPDAWVIELNDQTNNTIDIQDGDERDFNLEVFAEVPMKLIISAHLNLTVGNGTVSFDVWDPLVPDYVQTISYVFNVSPHIMAVSELSKTDFFQFMDGKLYATNGEKLTVTVVNTLGKVLYEAVDVLELNVADFEIDSMHIITISQGDTIHQIKLVQ